MNLSGLILGGILIVFLLLASSCGGDDETVSPPTDTPTLIPTSLPIATPTTDSSPVDTDEPSDDLVALGRELYLNVPPNVAPQPLWCFHCHMIDGISGASGTIGPDHTHLATWAAGRKSGFSAKEYIRESIVNPTAFVAQDVERSIPGLMTEAITEKLTAEQIEALVAFLLTLK